MELLNINEVMDNKFVGNTTIAVFFTNARFDKTKLGKIAGMAHDGYARSIRPVHTTADGDSIYAVSLGEVNADLDVVGTLAARVDLGGDYKSSGTCRQCLRISGDEGTVDEEVSIFDLCIQEPVCGLLSHFIGTQFPMK